MLLRIVCWNKLVALFCCFVFCASIFFPSQVVTIANATNRDPVRAYALMKWFRAGWDEHGNKLPSSRLFPWQKTEKSVWGREGYPMTDSFDGKEVFPVFYTRLYLSPYPSGILASASDPLYVVFDNRGNLWFDTDAIFHNPHADQRRNPVSPSFIPGSCVDSNILDGSIRYSVDPISSNNTRGPYSINDIRSGKQVILEIGKRTFQIALLDLEDFLPNSLVKDGDEDLLMPLLPFRENEKHADQLNNNGSYDSFEWIYRVTDIEQTFVQTGDMRLSTVFDKKSSIIYEVNSIVNQDDWDVGIPLIAFQDNEKHTDQIVQDSLYSVGPYMGYEVYFEHIYRSVHEKVSEGDLRLSSVNIHLNPTNLSLVNFGFTDRDALMLNEIIPSNTVSRVAVQTNYVKTSSFKLSAGLKSAYGDVPMMSNSLFSGTWIDTDTLISINFFHPVSPVYSGSIACIWWIDNGVNNLMSNYSDDPPIEGNLSDDYIEMKRAEQILGLMNRSPDLDFGLPLLALPENIRYVANQNDEWGAGLPFYRDNDFSFTVSVGDERLSDVIIIQGNNEIVYLAGSLVSSGDSDVGNQLTQASARYRFLDRHPVQPELTENQHYDTGELIIRKKDNYQHLSSIEGGDLRITSSIFAGKKLDKGSYVVPMTYFYHQSRAFGISSEKNGDFRYFDVPIVCGSEAWQIDVNPSFKVEQTVSIKLTFPDLKANERMYIIVDDTSQRNDTQARPIFIQELIGPSRGEYFFTLTPQRSSINTQGWVAPMTMIAFREKGGQPVAYQEFRDVVKQQWFFENIWDERALKYKDHLPLDFFPDTVTFYEALVHPEAIDIHASRDSLSPLDSRVPGFWAYARDQDNPEDINDPSPIISSFEGQQLIANVNAHGAGISYLLVAFAYFDHAPQKKERFIVQVNQDHSYWFWLWNDTAPKGVFNYGDTLSAQPVKIVTPPIWRNQDCAEKWVYTEDDPLGFNYITQWDHLGIFDGNEHRVEVDGRELVLSRGYVETFGIPVLAESYGTLSISDPGGDFPIPLLPLWGNDSLVLRVYFKNALLDFDDSILHPPWFVEDYADRINYLGYLKIPVIAPGDINFSDFSAVDMALQYSDVNYTAGENPLSPLSEPVIAAPYNPILRDLQRDLAVYPGGQAHVVRTAFRMGVGQQRFRRGPSMGYNAYPSITLQSDPLTYIRKLGTEHAPFTDYSFFFTLKNKAGEYLRFDMDAPAHLRVQRIEINGPFKCPKIIKPEEGSVIPETGYPVSYHYDGPYIIDREISKWYQTEGKNWTNRIGFGKNEILLQAEDANPLLKRTKLLDYRGLPHVFALQEITPIQGGVLTISVYTANGQIAELELPVHGLEISNVPDSIELGMDHVLRPVLRENEPFQQEEYCNNALVYLWQDRGIRLYSAMLLDPIEMGAGDGRLNRNVGEWMDLNLDGKISFGDYETEIIGTYDLATNTWMGGVYDGRTFNVNMGIYPLELTASNNARITQFGSDFGSRSGRTYRSSQDHIVSSDEECPVYVTAYKYYDDNNDRAFTPLYQRNSHEVYRSGEHRIHLKPQESLIVDVYPSPLTAGCVPELVSQGTPLTFTVHDSSGIPLDFRFGVMDPRGRSDVLAEDIHQHLFCDTPDEPLPQYYWLRTDLHNNDLGYASNVQLYSKAHMNFSPIRVDFSRSYEGKYSFYNFCANDEGAFEVKVYTPDRTQMGRVMVYVVPPKVEYTITPMMTRGRMFQGMGQIQDPDFIMTAGANKFYMLSMRAFNAQGQLIRGVQRTNPFRNPDERDVVFHSGRMTPYTTLPASNHLELHFSEVPSPYFLHMTLWETSENIEIHHSNTFPLKHINDTVYNTTNVRYDEGNYAISGQLSQNNSIMLNNGWGYGCIYNHPHSNVYCFADLNNDQSLSSEDSLRIGTDGLVRMILHAEDVCNFGVLVGANFFSDHELFSDVVGLAPEFSDDPSTLRGRFRRSWRPIQGFSQADGIFALDWDAFPERNLTLAPPRMTITSAETGLPYRRDLLNPANYDLVYGITNHIQVFVHPADPRDFPISEGTVRLFGNTHEAYVHSSVENIANQSIARISFTPTGVGESIARLLFTSKNILYDRENPVFSGPGQYATDPHIVFDSVRALNIVFPEGSFLQSHQQQNLKIRIQEKGTQQVVSGVEVSLSSSERSLKLTTDENGELAFLFNPIENEILRLYAFKDNYLEVERWLKVEN